jgi:hypothetical protein
MTTANDMYPMIGQVGDLYVGDLAELRFAVRVVDVRQRFGRIDVLVTPLAGDGQAWKSLDSITNLRGESSSPE